jgi:histidine triad (HIT) family protein
MDDCLFCKIINKEIPSQIVYEDDKTLVFKDLEPQAPIHYLIVPKQHFDNLTNVPAGNDIISHIFTVATKMAVKEGVSDTGFRIVNNCGLLGGQSVNHLHFHFLAGRQMKWPPG